MPADNISLKLIVQNENDTIKHVHDELSTLGMGFKDISLVFVADNRVERTMLLYNAGKSRCAAIMAEQSEVEGIRCIDID